MAQRSRVLIVEDEETLRETIADLIRDDGHEVRVAADGIDALAQTDGWQPDLVILDVMLPRMDAFEFRKRQLAAGHVAKILLVSAAPDLSSAAERLDADAWLPKPFSVDAMIDTVNDLLGRGGTPSNGPQTMNGAMGPSTI
ncbi:MAG TPA: response regulator [Candidatus Limnocylindria bacterium]|nr:response regulator [Candidatus Limnocylindria bacterium]